MLKVMAAVTDHLRELGSLQFHDTEQQEKEMESEVDMKAQHHSILCKLSALKTELSKVSELHPRLVTSSKDERIAEKQRSILKVIRALKEEVHRIAELQEREKECSTKLDVITHHKEVLKKLASLQEELVKLLRGLRDLSWEVVHWPCGCLFDEFKTSSSVALSLSSLSEPSSTVETNQAGVCSPLAQAPTPHPKDCGIFWVIWKFAILK